jgi:hypothetical protein
MDTRSPNTHRTARCEVWLSWQNTGKGRGVENMSTKAKRILVLLNDPKHRNHMMNSLNNNTLDNGAAPLGNGEMILLKDMEEAQDQEHDQHMQDLKGGGRGE